MNQAIRRLQREFVEFHRSVGHAGCCLGIKLEPVVMRGGDRQATDFEEAVKNRTRQSSPLTGFGATTDFIEEYKRVWCCGFEHRSNCQNVGGKSAEMIR